MRDSSPTLRPWRINGLAALFFMLCTAGCTPVATDAKIGSALPSPIDTASDNVRGYWWRETGDRVLADLVDAGLARDRQMTCEVLALDRETTRAAARAKRLDVRIGRLFGARDGAAERAVRRAHAYRHAAHRARLAARIAQGYLEVRRLQEVLALREALQTQFADNGEIAAFRREAGLVSGIDTGLAGSLLAVSATERDTTRTRYVQALARLAGLTHTDTAALERMLGQEGKVPDIGTEAGGAGKADLVRRPDLLALRLKLTAQLIRKGLAPDVLDASGGGGGDEAFADAVRASYRKAQERARMEISRANDAVAVAGKHEADLAREGLQARRTVEDARLGYRLGTEDFATLFVAEAAALAVEEARVTARADLAEATIRMWTGLGGGWEDEDLAPQVLAQDTSEVPVCE
ncbi:MAG: TolC family protein [Novosphingobium sp.]